MPARHAATLEIPKGIAIGNSPIEIKVRKGNTVLGTLKVASTNVEWRKRNAKKATKQLKWADFIELMEDA